MEKTLSGRWRGHYETPYWTNPDNKANPNRFRLSMVIEETNGQISGTMVDHSSTGVFLYRDYVRKWPSKNLIERVQNAIYVGKYPEMLLLSVLSQDSTISGTRDGHNFEFLKTYLHMGKSGYRYMDQDLEVYPERLEPVRYVGKADASFTKIFGHWCTDLQAEVERDSCTFEFVRED